MLGEEEEEGQEHRQQEQGHMPGEEGEEEEGHMAWVRTWGRRQGPACRPGGEHRPQPPGRRYRKPETKTGV